jgi:hypothetical protein
VSLLWLLLLALLAVLLAPPASATLLLPAPFPPSNGGWFSKERKIKPAAGRQPHIAFILL